MASHLEPGAGRTLTDPEDRAFLEEGRRALRSGEIPDGRRVLDRHGNAWLVVTRFREIAGRMEPTSVEVHSTSDEQILTREILKSLPFGRVFSAARPHLEFLASEVGQELGDDAFIEEARAMYGSRRGKRLGDNQLQAVADAYTQAYAAGEPVVRAVADSCFISVSAAAKRIRAARDAGLLPEPQQRRQAR